MNEYILCRNGTFYKIKPGRVTIGRHAKNNLVLDYIKVGRFHAVLLNTGRSLYLNPEHTVNGTYDKHGKQIPPGKLVPLEHNDVFGIGEPASKNNLSAFTVYILSKYDNDDVKQLKKNDINLIKLYDYLVPHSSEGINAIADRMLPKRNLDIESKPTTLNQSSLKLTKNCDNHDVRNIDIVETVIVDTNENAGIDNDLEISNEKVTDLSSASPLNSTIENENIPSSTALLFSEDKNNRLNPSILPVKRKSIESDCKNVSHSNSLTVPIKKKNLSNENIQSIILIDESENITDIVQPPDKIICLDSNEDDSSSFPQNSSFLKNLKREDKTDICENNDDNDFNDIPIGLSKIKNIDPDKDIIREKVTNIFSAPDEIICLDSNEDDSSSFPQNSSFLKNLKREDKTDICEKNDDNDFNDIPIGLSKIKNIDPDKDIIREKVTNIFSAPDEVICLDSNEDDSSSFPQNSSFLKNLKREDKTDICEKNDDNDFNDIPIGLSKIKNIDPDKDIIREKVTNIFSAPDEIICLDSDEDDFVENLSQKCSQLLSYQSSSSTPDNSLLEDVKNADEIYIPDDDYDEESNDVKSFESCFWLNVYKDFNNAEQRLPIVNKEESQSEKTSKSLNQTHDELVLAQNYVSKENYIPTNTIINQPIKTEISESLSIVEHDIVHHSDTSTTTNVITTATWTASIAIPVTSKPITEKKSVCDALTEVNNVDYKRYYVKRPPTHIGLPLSTESKDVTSYKRKIEDSDILTSPFRSYTAEKNTDNNSKIESADSKLVNSSHSLKMLNEQPDTHLKSVIKKSNSLKKNKTLNFEIDSKLEAVRLIAAEKRDRCNESKENIPYMKRAFYANIEVNINIEFQNALCVICKWNVMWLTEQVYQDQRPPLYLDDGFKYEPYGKYSNPRSYIEKLKYMLYHDIWKQIFSDWESANNMAIPETQFITTLSQAFIKRVIVQSVLKGSSYEEKHKKNSINRNLCIVHTYRVLNYEQSQTDVINRGHLITINVKMSNNEKGRTLLFGYIHNNYKIYCKDMIDQTAYNLSLCDGEPYVIEHVDIITAERPFDILPNSVVKIVVLSYVGTMLRLLSALSLIQYTPVMNAIIFPQNYDYRIENQFKVDRSLQTKKNLSESQRRAVHMCLNLCMSPKPNLCIIDGAAGTGKTTVIINVVAQIINAVNNSPYCDKKRLLIATKHDYEADDIILRLIKLKQLLPANKTCNIVRYGGQPTKDRVEKYSLGYMVKSMIESNAEDLIQLKDEKNIIKAKIESSNNIINSFKNFDMKDEYMDAGRVDKTISRAMQNIRMNKIILSQLENDDALNSDYIKGKLKKLALATILENADIFVASFSACYSREAENHFVPNSYNRGEIIRIDTCIMDDFSTYTETYSLIPAMFRVSHLLLIGDSGQIVLPQAPPPVHEETLFNRLLKYKNRPENRLNVFRLNVQFRMDPEIFRWPDRYFYPDVQHVNNCLNSYRNLINPYIILNHNYPDCDGVTNEDEADLIMLIIDTIINSEHVVSDLKIAVITSNRDQLEVIKYALRKSETILKKRIGVLMEDDIYGRQYDVILISLAKPPNFSIIPVWLNRVLTRAVSSVIICGNFHEQEENIMFTKMLEDARNRNVLRHIVSQPNQISRHNLPHIIFKNVNIS